MIAGLLRAASNLAFVAAVVLAVFTFVGDHSSDYGGITLPGSGEVELPKGSVEVFYQEADVAASGQAPDLVAPVSFRVVPVDGGRPVVASSGSREIGLGSSGEISSFETDFAGTYRVTGNVSARQVGAELTFGTDAATAVTRRSELFLGLIGGGVLAGVLSWLLRRRRHGDPVDRPYDVHPESMQQAQGDYYTG